MVGEPGGAATPADELWAVVERTRPADVDPAAHAEALTRELVAAGVEAVVVVSRQFDRAVATLETWDLWATAYVLLLGCGDDSFEYLRAWIVGQGRDAYEHAVRDPEGYLVSLVAGTEHDEELVAERIEELGVLDGEPLLYAAGVAHEQLTGSWPPAEPGAREPGPRGEPWDVDGVAARVPRLVAALPDNWLGVADAEPGPIEDALLATAAGPRTVGDVVDDVLASGPTLDTVRRVQDGLAAHEAGDSRAARELLGPVVEDPARWEVVHRLRLDPQDVAYVTGISHLMAGDVDGSARALRVGLAAAASDDRLRRALAQVELARGDLAAAELLVDPGPKAELMDRALLVTLRWRQGQHDAAGHVARALVGEKPRRQERRVHPWTVAGALLQAALVLAEIGDLDALGTALTRIDGLIAGAPPELPVARQRPAVVGSVLRQQGRLDEAEHLLAETAPLLDPETCDLGVLQREQARIARARHDGSVASMRYQKALATFEAAGERWHAGQVRHEASG